jgi:hypothetical protein
VGVFGWLGFFEDLTAVLDGATTLAGLLESLFGG